MMRCRIAGLIVDIDCGGRIIRQAEKYRIDAVGEPDFTVRISPLVFKNTCEAHPDADEELVEYMLSGNAFARELLNYNGFMLHSSALAYQGYAYLFSAPSGTGKSTHSQMWKNAFGESNVTVINDDKPIVRKIDGVFYACGTPWSGKGDISCNINVPIKAVFVIERAEENRVEHIDSAKAFELLFQQTLRKMTGDKIGKLLAIFDDFITNIPIYKLYCRPDESAAVLAKKTANGNL